MASAFDEFESLPSTSPEPPPPGPPQRSAFDEFEQPATSPTSAGTGAEQSVSVPPIREAGGPPETVQSAFTGLEPPEQTEAYSKLRSEMDRGPIDSLRQSPAIKSTPITDADLGAIAGKHGVSAADLRDWMPYFLGTPTESDVRLSDIPKFAAGTVGTALGNLPQKLAKRMQSPQMELALDDLQELANRRLSLLGAGATIAAPTAGVAGTAGLGAKLAAGAATGGAFGLGGSRAGHEVEGTLVGAGLGLGLSGAAAGVSRMLGGAARRAEGAAASEAEQAVDRVAQRGGADFEQGVREAVDARQPADAIIQQHIFGDLEQLSPEQARAVANAYAPHAVADLTDAGTETGRTFIERLKRTEPSIDAAGITQAAEREVAQTAVDNATDQMARDVFKRSVAQSDDPRAMLRSWAGQAERSGGTGPERVVGRSGQGTEYAQQRLKGLLDADTAAEHVRGARGITETQPQSWLAQKADQLSDVQYPLRSFDEKWKGLGAEAAYKDLNWGINRMSFPWRDMRDNISKWFIENRRAGLDSLARDGGEIIRKVEAGEHLTPGEARVYAPLREYFDRGLVTLEKLADEEHLPRLAIVKAGDNYIPAAIAETSVLQDTLARRLDQMVSQASRETGRQFRDISDIPQDVFSKLITKDAENQSTIKFLSSLNGNELHSPGETLLAYKELFFNPQGRDRLDTFAKAALERKDAIPLWARETNLYKLAHRWANNSLSDLYLRGGIDKLRNASRMLGTLRATREQEYVDKLIADMVGRRKGTAAEYFSRAQEAYYTNIDRRIRRANSPWQKGALTTMRALPTILQDLTKQMYPNLLSTPRATIANLTQTFTKTLPEFGTPYGSLLFLRGAMRIGGIRNLPKMLARAEAMGLSANKVMDTSADYLAEGLLRSMPAQKVTSVFRGLANAAMWPFAQAESLNRAIAFGASEMMANDLMRGSKLAETALMRMPSSVRTAVAQARTSGDLGEMVRQLATHMVNTTQLQYNRASMAEYGRTMGPMLSAFTKWPTSILGQMVEGYRTKGPIAGTVRLGEQLVAPWLLFQVADRLMGEGTDEGLSDRQKLLFGSQGLSQAAPIGSLGALATGEMFTPPVVDAAVQLFIDPARESDSQQMLDKMKRSAENSLYTFAPGGLGGWIRLVTDNGVTMVTGERPEGSTTLERAGLNPFGRDE